MPSIATLGDHLLIATRSKVTRTVVAIKRGERCEQQKELEQIYGELEEKYKITKKERDRLREQSAKEFGESVIWKFKYLNIFFTPHTKNILGLFSTATVSRQTFELAYEVIIPDHAQRNLCLQVLLENDMLREKDGLIEITPEGRLFLRFIDWKV